MTEYPHPEGDGTAMGPDKVPGAVESCGIGAGLRRLSPVLFPIEDGAAADRLSERMRNLGIECSVQGSRVARTLVLEPPLQMPNGIHSIDDTWIGAFSYSWSRIASSVRSIGRYCSIAGDVTFGELEHPTDWLSTSSFTYESGWMWKRFATTHGREHHAHDYPPERKHPPITIGNDVWIGLGAYIRGGVHLGSGCIVGAKAVVTKDVPPYAVVVGNPARVTHYRFGEATIEALLELQWWRHSFVDLAGLPVHDVHAMIEGIRMLQADNAIPVYAPVCLQLVATMDEVLAESPVSDVRRGEP